MKALNSIALAAAVATSSEACIQNQPITPPYGDCSSLALNAGIEDLAGDVIPNIPTSHCFLVTGEQRDLLRGTLMSGVADGVFIQEPTALQCDDRLIACAVTDGGTEDNAQICVSFDPKARGGDETFIMWSPEPENYGDYPRIEPLAGSTTISWMHDGKPNSLFMFFEPFNLREYSDEITQQRVVATQGDVFGSETIGCMGEMPGLRAFQAKLADLVFNLNLYNQ